MRNRLAALGDQAWLAEFDDAEDAAAWSAACQQALCDRNGVTDVVLAYQSVAVYYDASRLDPWTLRDQLDALTTEETAAAPASRLIEIPVLYEGDDLLDVATRLGLTPEEVVATHSGRPYRVFALGFLPGFPYCGTMPDSLAGLPRRTQPRTRVEAGTVAIAGRQTGIYPQASPGGWHAIGRTPLTLVDLRADHFPIRPGDHITFRPIDPGRFASLRGACLSSI